jgi:hypothetical protein
MRTTPDAARRVVPTLASLPPEIRDQVIIMPGGCWEWTGREYYQGYGAIWWNKKKCRVHRVVYELLVGEIEAETLDHLCRNRRCVNPVHLEPVSNHVNTLRGRSIVAINARKMLCKRGHPLAGENLQIGSYRGRPMRRCRTCRAAEWERRQQTKAPTGGHDEQ